MKLLPSRRKFCVHHTTMHQFTVSLGACVFSCDKDSDTEPEILRFNENERVTILMSRGLEWVAEHLKKRNLLA